MSLVGSAFGRALAGFGAGAGALANQYISEELQQQRAKFLEDLRMQGVKAMDEHNNSPERRERMRQESVKDSEAAAASALRSDIARASNTELQDATIAGTNRVTEGTAGAKASAAGQIKRAESENTVRDLSPGQQSVIGGQVVAENKRPTSQEVQDGMYRDGLKGQASASPNKNLSDAGKLQLNELSKREDKLEEEWSKSVMGGTAKNDPSDPGYQFYKQKKTEIAVQKMRVMAREGLIDGAEDAQNVARIDDKGNVGERNPDILMRAKEQAALIGGTYARDFNAVIDPVLQAMGDPKDYKRRSIMEAARAEKDENFNIQIGKGPVEKVRNGQPQAAPAKPAAASGGQSWKDSLEGKTFAERRQAIIERANRPRPQEDPRIAPLEDEYRRLIRAGRAVEANAVLEQIKQIRTE